MNTSSIGILLILFLLFTSVFILVLNLFLRSQRKVEERIVKHLVRETTKSLQGDKEDGQKKSERKSLSRKVVSSVDRHFESVKLPKGWSMKLARAGSDHKVEG